MYDSEKQGGSSKKVEDLGLSRNDESIIEFSFILAIVSVFHLHTYFPTTTDFAVSIAPLRVY